MTCITIVAIPTGSSPRVRGKPRSYWGISDKAGLIPACAGKTSLVGVAGPGFGAHPRVCGENPGDRTEAATLEGSSPRVRGKRL